MKICHLCLIHRLSTKNTAANITIGTSLTVVALNQCSHADDHRKILEAKVLKEAL